MKIEMVRVVCLLLLIGAADVRAQDAVSDKEFWPEIDVYLPLSEKVRLSFLATVSKNRETKDVFEGQVGAHADYFLRHNITLRAGYRYGFSINNSDDPYKEHRIIVEQTWRRHLPMKMLLSDRNREDLRWVNGDFSLRYRNRVTIEREFKIGERSITPYGSGEIYYDTRFDTWNRNRLSAGIQIGLKKRRGLLFPIRGQRVIDIYYMRQNDSRSRPNHVNAIGTTFSIHF